MDGDPSHVHKLGRADIVKMFMLHKIICKFRAVPIKVPMILFFFMKIGKPILILIWNDVRPHLAKAILIQKNEAGDVTLPDLTSAVDL